MRGLVLGGESQVPRKSIGWMRHTYSASNAAVPTVVRLLLASWYHDVPDPSEGSCAANKGQGLAVTSLRET